jgi:hypothetical protein
MVTGAATGSVNCEFDPTSSVIKLSRGPQKIYVIQSNYTVFMFQAAAPNSWNNSSAVGANLYATYTNSQGVLIDIYSQGNGWYTWAETPAYWQQFAAAYGYTVGTYP